MAVVVVVLWCGRPLPQPTLHVFLMHGSSLALSLLAVERADRRGGERVVKFLLMECQEEPVSGGGQMNQGETHCPVEKCTQETRSVAQFILPLNSYREPMNP